MMGQPRFSIRQIRSKRCPMTVWHTINPDKKLITTVWTGEATDGEFIVALSKYQLEIKSQPEYVDYDEVLDLSGTTSFKLTPGGLRRLADIGAKTDNQSSRTRLAIIVTQTVAYGLARMYQTYRSFIPNASKEVKVFRNSFPALQWIGASQRMEE